MTSVGSYQAKTHLPELLQRVSKGERILITRRGQPIALLTQPPRTHPRNIRGILRQMDALRRGNILGKDLSIRDIIEEGRRF